MRVTWLSLLLTLLLFATGVRADPLSPKVCVVVAGDPDVAVRSAAAQIADAIAARSDLRGVADADVRAVLRGETRNDASLVPLVEARRALTANDDDAMFLDRLGQRLGCTLVIEMAARPAGILLRPYDVVHHAFREAREVPTLDASLMDTFVVMHARAALGSLRPAAAQGAVVLPSSARSTGSARRGGQRQGEPRRDSGPALWAWAVAGGAALLLVGGFLLAQSSTPSAPVIVVTHAGGETGP